MLLPIFNSRVSCEAETVSRRLPPFSMMPVTRPTSSINPVNMGKDYHLGVGRSLNMKYYAMVEIDITDQSWISDYVKNVTPMLERHGGRYLPRTSKIERMERDREPPQVVVLVEFPSKDAAERFYASDEYRPYLQSRKAGGKNEFLLFAGE